MEKDNSRYNLRELARSINPQKTPEFELVFLMIGGKRIKGANDVVPGYFSDVGSIEDFMDAIRTSIHPEDFGMVLEEKQYLTSLEDYPQGDTNNIMVVRVKPLDDRFGDDKEKYGYFRFWRKIIRKRGHEDIIHFICHDITKELELIQITLAPEGLDPVTGIKTKPAFEAFCMLQRPNVKLETLLNYVSVLRIDDYEMIKEKYGQEGVDKVVRRAGDVLRSVQNQAVIARYSEDTFLFIIHNARNEQEARTKIQTVARRMKTPLDESYTASVSAGFAQCMHDRERGYCCAYELAFQALESQKENDKVTAYTDIQN